MPSVLTQIRLSKSRYSFYLLPFTFEGFLDLNRFAAQPEEITT